MKKVKIDTETAIKIVGCLAGFEAFLCNTNNVSTTEIPVLTAMGIPVGTNTVSTKDVIINGVISYDLIRKHLCIGTYKYYFSTTGLFVSTGNKVGEIIKGFNDELIGFSYKGVQYTFMDDKIHIQSSSGLSLADYEVEFIGDRLVCFSCGDDTYVIDRRKQLTITTSSFRVVIDKMNIIDSEDFFNI